MSIRNIRFCCYEQLKLICQQKSYTSRQYTVSATKKLFSNKTQLKTPIRCYVVGGPTNGVCIENTDQYQTSADKPTYEGVVTCSLFKVMFWSRVGKILYIITNDVPVLFFFVQTYSHIFYLGIVMNLCQE